MPDIVSIGDQPQLVPTSKFPLIKFPFEYFNPIQSRVVEFYDQPANVVVAAATSAGKAQPNHCPILTPNGYTRMGDIRVGDDVVGVDGKPTAVQGVYPQGSKDVYRIVLNDGTSTLCCSEHLWTVRSRYDKYHGHGYRVLSVEEMTANFKSNFWTIPLVNPVEFPYREFVIHPYVLGMLLGGGGIIYGVKISNKDEDVLRRFTLLLSTGMKMILDSKSSTYKGCDYRICGEVDHFNPVARELDKMCLLGKGSASKFIPYTYKFASIEQRIELLRGLLDSDGYRANGGSAEFGTCSKLLAEDVAFLVRSLGGRTRIRSRDCVSYSYKGEKRRGLPCYRLTISIENIVPFHCMQKCQEWRLHTRRCERKIEAIEPAGMASCTCIKIANPDGLYITNDFIVTHNTACAEMLLAYEWQKRGGKGMYIAPLKALSQEKVDDWTSDDHDFSSLNISICTGDYRLTTNRHQELVDSNIVLMTSEMLNSRTRNFHSEHNDWLKDIGTLVTDECLPSSALIETDQGLIPIGDIIDRQIDVKVASYNHKHKRVEFKRILSRQRKSLKRKWLSIHYKGGCISVTSHHLVYCEGDGYTYAKDVKVGDVIYVRTIKYGRASDFGDSFGGRMHHQNASLQVGEVTNTATFQTDAVNRMEVLSVEETGSHSAEDSTDSQSNWVYQTKDFPRQKKVENLGRGESYCCDLEIEDNNNFFANGVLVHNSHLLTVPGRGDKLEVALMKMAALNPDCRHVFLSATMPNVEDMAGWLSKLTDRDTIILQSDYRPVPLKWNWPIYNDGYWEYKYKEMQKVNEAASLVDKYHNDKFLIFVHGKSTGDMMCQVLRDMGLEVYFHNADLEKQKRIQIENRFRNDPTLRVIVATSTLAQGMNLPARRVIILGTHRGLSPVPTYEIEQEAGRAGRPKYDQFGDVYVLLPRSECGAERLRLQNPDKIRSQLLQHGNKDYRTFAFHLVNEIAQKDVKRVEDIYKWYSRSLAAYQFRNLEDDFVDHVLEKLISCKAVWEEGGELEATSLGKVAAMFYYSPFDVSDLRHNFTTLFDYKREEDTLWAAVALAHVDSNNDPPFVSNLEKSQLERFRDKLGYDLKGAFNRGKPFYENKIKMIFCYYSLLNGWNNPVFSAVMRGLKYDGDRLMQVLKALDGMSAKWKRMDYFTRLGRRLQYGVDWKLLDLIQVSQIGKVRAEKLWAVNIRSASDVVSKSNLVQAILHCSDKMLEKIVTGAKKVAGQQVL